MIWEVRRASNGSVYRTNLDSTLGISLSGGKLCATIPAPYPFNPACI